MAWLGDLNWYSQAFMAAKYNLGIVTEHPKLMKRDIIHIVNSIKFRVKRLHNVLKGRNSIEDDRIA